VTVSLTEVSAGRDVHIQVNSAVRDDQFWRYRSQMLKRVRFDWITQYLELSLDQLARIQLGLTTKPDAVDRPFDLLIQRPKQVPHPLPTGTPISHIFTDSGNALLILGEPGAGKTTLLLELTRDLLNRAEQDERHRIPVVFMLSSWAEDRLALADWLVDELNKRYDVPRKLAQAWVEADVILPLLDGLDEVAADYRDACVTAINGFVHEHGLVPLVVCSRRVEYEALSVRLRLPNAVMIQSLSRQQIHTYVEQAGTSLAGLHRALREDAPFWELLDTPLMLSIVALAYQGRSAAEIQAARTLEEQRRHVFAAYTDAMFHRGAPTPPYTQEQTEHWLTWLAQTMKAHDQSVFYLEWMQPNWLPGQRQQRLVTFLTSVMRGLMYGLSGGLLIGLREGLGKEDLFVGLGCGLFFGLLGGLGGEKFFLAEFYGLLYGERQPLEKRQWSWSVLRHAWLNKLPNKRQLYQGLFLGLLGELLLALRYGLPVGLLSGLLLGLVYGLAYGLPVVLLGGLSVGEIGTKSFPNEGIKRSLRNALTIGLVCWLSLGLSGGLFVGLLGELFVALRYGLAFGLLGGLRFALASGLRFGGHACLHHCALRLVLWYKNFAPFNYVHFLDYAAARVFLYKVGGGYVFIHRMLLEYFAAMPEASAERQI
jgi:hypothetical protein